MKKRLWLIGIGLVVLASGWWFFGHGFVEIKVENAESGDVSYSLLDQAKLRSADTTTSATTIKKLVRRGSHEVRVQQGERSYLAVVKVGGFLTSSQVQATLVAEKDRQFVGNNPGLCMDLADGVLLSSTCNDTIDRLQVHVSASATSPTLIKTGISPLSGTVEGTLTTSQGSFVLIKARESTEEEGAPHTLYRLLSNGNVSSPVALDDLHEGEFYNLTPAGDGFVVFTTAGDHILHYPTVGAPSVTVEAAPAENGSQLYAVNHQDGAFMLVYAEKGIIEDVGFEDLGGEEAHTEAVEEALERSAKAESRIVIQTTENSQTFSLPAQPTKVIFCGSDKLCAIANETLAVYDIASSKPKLEFKLQNTVAVAHIANGLLATTRAGVYLVDLDSRSGSAIYSFGEYGFCGLKAYAQAALLCVQTDEGKRSVLVIDLTRDNDDSIDKKVAQLLKLSEVKDVSAYKQFIFISPELGDLVTNPTTGDFEYDPATRQRVADLIRQKVDELGIDRTVYTVINTLE